jgi:hypothetical protein
MSLRQTTDDAVALTARTQTNPDVERVAGLAKESARECEGGCKFGAYDAMIFHRKLAAAHGRIDSNVFNSADHRAAHEAHVSAADKYRAHVGDALPTGALERALDRLAAGFDHPMVTPLVELEPGTPLTPTVLVTEPLTATQQSSSETTPSVTLLLSLWSFVTVVSSTSDVSTLSLGTRSGVSV